jgi:hypothetical protein
MKPTANKPLLSAIAKPATNSTMAQAADRSVVRGYLGCDTGIRAEPTKLPS